MQQQRGDTSVSHLAVFVEPLASDDSDRGYIWVKMPRAAVEEQVAARPESRIFGDSEGETAVTCSRRVTGGKRLVMWTLERLMSSHSNFTARQRRCAWRYGR